MVNFPPAPPGNKRGVAVKDPEERARAFQSYCEHIASGYPKGAWFYLSDVAHCSWETMEKYIKENPTEFDAFLVECAKAASYRKWFARGENLSDGKVKGNPSPHTWATIMRNMFSWDKENKNQTEDRLAELKNHALQDDQIRKKMQEDHSSDSSSSIS